MDSDSIEASDDEVDMVVTDARPSAAESLHHLDAGSEDIDPTSESAILQLQLKGILSDLRAGAEERQAEAGTHLAKLQKRVSKLPVQHITGADHAELLESLGVDAACHMQFSPPSKVELTGPALFQAVPSSDNGLDVLLHMPASCLLLKDFNNHKYHAKRLLYLLHIAAALQRKRFCAAFWLECPHSDVRRPLVCLQLAGSDTAFRLHAAPPRQLFKLGKLAPGRNCLRTATATSKQPGAEPQLVATPVYNASVLADVLGHGHCCHLAALLATARLRDTALLLGHWVTQQLPESRHRPCLVQAVWLQLAHGVESARVSAAMTALQAFRATLAALAARDSGAVALQRCPLGGLPDGGEPPSLKAHTAATPCAAVDASGHLNVLAGVPASTWALLRTCAQHTLASLSGPAAAAGAVATPAFAAAPCNGCAFDALLTVRLAAAGPAETRLAADLPADCAAAVQAERLLGRALQDRVAAVVVFPPPAARVAAASSLPGLDPRAWLCVGLLFNAKEAFRIVDRGPAADSGKAAAAFRNLWGERSDMRRFPDGSIHEAVAWDAVPPAARASIPDQIVTYIIEHHLPGTRVGGSAMMLAPALAPPDGVDASEAAAAPRALDAALHSLAQRLRKVTGLTLGVVSTQVFGAAARHTCPFPPLPHPLLQSSPGRLATDLPRCMQPAEMLVQLEGSGKWPDNEVAMGKMRAALGCELAVALEAQFGLAARAAEAHVDVPVDGFMLRLRLWSDRDETLAERSAKGLKLAGPAREALVTPCGLAALRQQAAVQHHGLVAGVVGEHPSAAGACQLAQRWSAGQLLSGHLPVEALELLVAAVYSGKHQQAAPASALCGFLRFLALLAAHEWPAHPLVVDPTGAMATAQVAAALKAFQSRRATGAVPACFLVTPYDASSSAWTAERPAREVMARATHVAAEALSALTAPLHQLAFVPEDAWQAAFLCDLAAFDALVLLRSEALPDAAHALQPSALERWAAGVPGVQVNSITDVLDVDIAVPRQARAILAKIPKAVVQKVSAKMLRRDLLVGIDPLRHLLAALEDRLGHVAVFCVDAIGGDVIGIKWRPKAFLPGPISVATAHTAMPCVTTGRAGSFIVDVFAVMQEVMHLGLGIVADVLLCC